ncbi:MFS transporter, putative metabolite:H+ symporter [Propionispira arboris]|uniref:MFS transporter, putative metabolite:H+ symporter n=1 Tax=Propionispira arboris TaxID=84035 RepID=A0A1H7A0G4_9FIRM|nr:MFS transporter [Propionispira arboris]SEJ59189.1 MFS transporter, putative metabolite:H+ symporter [Propionispira arboris]
MDLINRLERIPVNKFHYQLLFVTGLGWMFDAMDTGIIAFVLPTLAKIWGLSTPQMGYIGSIGLVGMAIGAVLAGELADRFGRKKMFMATLLLYSVATGLCSIAWSFESLLVFRFLVGFGLGGQLPVAVTLVTEFAPAHLRGRFIVLLESFWGLGWLAAALISYLVIPRFGWHVAFILGALPALYVFYIFHMVPESVRYLINKGDFVAADKIVRRIEKQAGIISPDSLFDAESACLEQTLLPKVKISFRELLQPAFLKRTLMLWCLWFGIVYSYYGIFTWLPSLMVSNGFTEIKSFEYVLIMTIAQLPGYLAAAYFVERIGRKATLVSFLGSCAVCAYFFGQGGTAGVILIWGSLMSFFNLGAWGVVYSYTPELYPTRIRAIGSGWAAAIGRVGGVLAPTVVGMMLARQSGFEDIFLMFTIVMLGVAGIVALFGPETKGLKLDEISKV